MKLLADENFPRAAVVALRAVGHDVYWIAEQSPSVSDDVVLHLAEALERTLLTFDKDFGELAFRQGRATHQGILLFRLEPQVPDEIAAKAVAAVSMQESWTGCFAVVTRERLRVRFHRAS